MSATKAKLFAGVLAVAALGGLAACAPSQETVRALEGKTVVVHLNPLGTWMPWHGEGFVCWGDNQKVCTKPTVHYADGTSEKAQCELWLTALEIEYDKLLGLCATEEKTVLSLEMDLGKGQQLDR